jgi:hypothetical protein
MIAAICVICMDRFNNYADMSVCECGHVFHQVCIKDWLAVDVESTCPQCRVKVTPAFITNGLYFSEDDEEDENEVEKRELREAVHNMQMQLDENEKFVQQVLKFNLTACSLFNDF